MRAFASLRLTFTTHSEKIDPSATQSRQNALAMPECSTARYVTAPVTQRIDAVLQRGERSIPLLT